MKDDPLKIREAFGKRVKSIRMDKHLTQLDLAIKCGTDVSQIKRVESGTINTSLTMVYYISKALGVSMNELFDIKL